MLLRTSVVSTTFYSYASRPKRFLQTILFIPVSNKGRAGKGTVNIEAKREIPHSLHIDKGHE